MPLFRTILVADDEPSIRHILTLVLTGHGYDVRAVADGEDALKELAARDYDVLLCDVRMPKKDGLVVLREALASHPALTAVVMSAYGSQEQALQAVAAARSTTSRSHSNRTKSSSSSERRRSGSGWFARTGG